MVGKRQKNYKVWVVLKLRSSLLTSRAVTGDETRRVSVEGGAVRDTGRAQLIVGDI